MITFDLLTANKQFSLYIIMNRFAWCACKPLGFVLGEGAVRQRGEGAFHVFIIQCLLLFDGKPFIWSLIISLENIKWLHSAHYTNGSWIYQRGRFSGRGVKIYFQLSEECMDIFVYTNPLDQSVSTILLNIFQQR